MHFHDLQVRQPLAPVERLQIYGGLYMSKPQHCPGFEQFQHVQSFVCKCSHCGKEIEIFSDEFDKKHICKGCRKEIDFTQCTLESEA
jgi:hypothetical protein